MYPIRIFTLEEVSRIKLYKFETRYQPILYSLFLQKAFEKFQVYIPKVIMPNQITWAGYFSMLCSLIATVFFDPTLQTKPTFLPLINFILLFIYFSADFVDGIHARKTGQTSQLGALLDHGVDSVVVLFLIIALCSSLQLGISDFLMFFSFILFSGFYFVGIYIKYVGYMKLNYLSGQSEGLFLVMIIHILSFLIPKKMDNIKKTIGSSVQLYFKPFFMQIISTIVTLYSIAELFVDMNKNETLNRKYEALSSIFYVHLLFSFLYFLKVSNLKKNLVPFYSFMLIFGQCFTLCYVEETLSGMASSDLDLKVFIANYSILAIFVVTYLSFKRNSVALFCFMLSSVHFLLRIGSILYGLSNHLNARLFTRSF